MEKNSYHRATKVYQRCPQLSEVRIIIDNLVLVGCNSISEFTKLIWNQNLISKRWNLNKAESIFIFLQNEREM